MKLLLRKYGNALVPVDDAMAEEFNKLKSGQDYEIQTRKSRNPKFHRKFFALIKLGHDNTQLDMPLDSYRKYITMKAGFFQKFPTRKGEYIEPISIAFDSMDESEFEEVYNRVLDKIIEDTGADKEFVEKELMSFL